MVLPVLPSQAHDNEPQAMPAVLRLAEGRHLMADQLVELIRKHRPTISLVSFHPLCECGWRAEHPKTTFHGDEWAEHMAGVFRRYLNERPVIRKAPSEIGGAA